MNTLFLSLSLSSALSTFVITSLLIAVQKKLNLSPQQRSEALKGHEQKQGTASVGGIALLLSQLICLTPIANDHVIYLFLISSCGFFALGLIDDLQKYTKKGISARAKALTQFILASMTIFALYQVQEIASLFESTYFPFFGYLEIPVLLSFGIGVLALISTTNATNLTDGLDGLLALILIGVWSIIFVASLTDTLPSSSAIDNSKMAVIACVELSSLLAFLWFNGFKASIFMGDCGSLLLGARLSFVFICLGAPFFLLFFAFIPVLETLSVILQVVCFKRTGKRLFKCAPLHHHMEQSGWHENTITIRFALINFVFALLGLIIWCS